MSCRSKEKGGPSERGEVGPAKIDDDKGCGVHTVEENGANGKFFIIIII